MAVSVPEARTPGVLGYSQEMGEGPPRHPTGMLISHNQVWLSLGERLQTGRPWASSQNPEWVPAQRAQETPKRTSTQFPKESSLSLLSPL